MKTYSRLLAFVAITVFLFNCNMNQKKEQSTTLNPDVEIMPYGTIDSTDITQYTLVNANNMRVTVINYGAIITSIQFPDSDDTYTELVLGFDSLSQYMINKPYLGAAVGRYANRIGNAAFTLDGKKYTLAANDGKNTLHGGIVGFNKKVWAAAPYVDSLVARVAFSLLSPDGDEGYPGNLNVSLIVELNNNNELILTYEAVTDKATPVSLTHHSYFNLKGQGTILDQELYINSNAFTPVDENILPTGRQEDLTDNPLDFRTKTIIGNRIKDVPGGYDHNYVLSNPSAENISARVTDPVSGRWLELYTTMPGMQFYTANFLDETTIGRGGKPYFKHAGLCLEPQMFPDSPNQPNFPSAILQPGDTYKHVIKYKFGKN